MNAPLKQKDQRRVLREDWRVLKQQVLASLDGPSRAVAIYGSQARGTARQDSDVDVLQLVEARPRSYTAGRFSVTAYHPLTLTTMAKRGSLFVLHLVLDAVIVHDPAGELASVLESYIDPDGYDSLLAEVSAAAVALQNVDDTPYYWKGLRRLGIYLVRTAAYARLASRGTPAFGTEEAASAINIPAVTDALRLRLRQPSINDLKTLLEGLRHLLGPVHANRHGSVEALAIAYLDRHPHASALLAQVMIGDDSQLEYTALTPPPL